MKVKVLQRFRDKHDHITRYEVGTEHDFDAERAKDLIARGLAEPVKEADQVDEPDADEPVETGETKDESAKSQPAKTGEPGTGDPVKTEEPVNADAPIVDEPANVDESANAEPAKAKTKKSK